MESQEPVLSVDFAGANTVRKVKSGNLRTFFVELTFLKQDNSSESSVV